MICPQCGFDNVPGDEACAECQQPLTPFDQPMPSNRVEKSLMDDCVNTLQPARPVSIRSQAPLADAITLLSSKHLGALLVVDERGYLEGILSERDILKRVVGFRDDYAAVSVRDVMTKSPETVALSDTLAFALCKMDGGGYRHLPVLRDGKPVGVISVRDVLKHVSKLCRDS